MPFESWDLVMPDGTVLVANATSRRSAIARALVKPELPGEIAGQLQDADESATPGDVISRQGWYVAKHPYTPGRWD